MKEINLRFFGGFCVLALVMIFLDRQGMFREFRPVMQIILTPLEMGTYSVKNSVTDSISFLTFWKSGEARIKNLEQRNLELQIQANNEKILENENIELKKQLGVTSLSKFKRLPVIVLGVARFMIIDRGTKDGIVVGHSVAYLDNFVGQTVRSDASVSYVQLATDADFKIPVKVGLLGNVYGVSLGQFNSSIILDQVSQDEDIKIDDLVYTSGQTGKFIPDLLIGKIFQISSAKTDLFQKAKVKPLIVYDKLNTVFVIFR